LPSNQLETANIMKQAAIPPSPPDFLQRYFSWKNIRTTATFGEHTWSIFTPGFIALNSHKHWHRELRSTTAYVLSAPTHR